METSTYLSEIITSRYKVSKDTENLNNTINQLDLTDINKSIPYTNSVMYIISSAHRTLTMTGHTLDHKTNSDRNELKTQRMPSDYNRIKLKINYRKTYRKSPNTEKLAYF